MAHQSQDRILETSTSTGVGAFTVAGAITGFSTLASQLTVGDTFYGYIEGVDGSGNPSGEWEDGLYTYSGVNTVTRTTVIRSSNANAAVNFSAGTKRVGLTLLASRTAQFDNNLAMPVPAATVEPGTPTSGLMLYAREIIPGHTTLKTLRPSGIDSPVQDGLAWNTVKKFQGNGTVMVALNAAVLTVSAAGTAVTPASGSTKSQLERIQYATAATAGALHTIISPNDGNAFVFRGNVNGEGGGKFVIRFALNTLVAGNRGFWGLAASRTAATNDDPLSVAAPARLGLGFNANTGNWFLCWSDGTTAGSSDLGVNFPLNTTDVIELALFVRPHNGVSAGTWGYRVRRYTTNPNAPANEVTGTLSTNMPAATTLLHPWIFVTNNATASAVNWHFGSLTLEKDW